MTTTIIIIAALILIVAYTALFIKVRENNRLSEQNRKLGKLDFVANNGSDNCFFLIAPTPYGFLVLKKHPLYPDTPTIVKSFCDEDRDYARRCAEELCDKLNETL